MMMPDTTHQLALELLEDINKIAVVDGALNGTIDVIDGLAESFSCGERHHLSCRDFGWVD
jgi:hypothetical protein